MPISALEKEVAIVEVGFGADDLIVSLSDGRSLSTPLSWYPRLLAASASARRKFRLIGRGQGIHWQDIDEDLSLEGMLAGRKAVGA
jgi:hypothetical protein